MIQPNYANSVTIQSGRSEFLLTFNRLLPSLDEGQSLHREAISQVILPVSEIPAFIQALHNVWHNYQHHLEESKEP